MNPFSQRLRAWRTRFPASSPQMEPETNAAEESRLRTSLQQAYAAPEVSEDLRQRVLQLAVMHNQQQVMTRPARLRWPRTLLGGLLVLLMLVGFFAYPRIQAALTLRHTQIALRNVMVAHITTWQVLPDSSRRKQSEVFYNSGRWHIEKDYGAWVHEVHEATHALEHSAVVEETTRPLGFNHMDALSLLALPDDMILAGLQSRLQATDAPIARPGYLSGHPFVAYTWTMDNFPREAQDILLDKFSGLPVQCTWRHLDENDVWRTVAIVDYDFNTSSNGNSYAGEYQSRARKEGIGATRDEWEHRLQTPRMYTMYGKTRVALRDVRVNCDGDLFVLYTAGHKPGDYEDWAVSATDDRGNIYLNCHAFPFRPTIVKNKHVVGYTFNGEALEGAHLTPVFPLKDTGDAWKPRRFTIIMSILPDGYYRAYRRFGGLPRMPIRFTLPIEQADSQRVPACFPYMAMQPVGGFFEEYALQYSAAWTRAIYCRDTRHDPTQALTWFLRLEEIMNAEMRLHHWQANNVFLLLEQAKLQTQLGRPQEARQTLLRANARRAYADAASVRDLDKALKKAGLRH